MSVLSLTLQNLPWRLLHVLELGWVAHKAWGVAFIRWSFPYAKAVHIPLGCNHVSAKGVRLPARSWWEIFTFRQQEVPRTAPASKLLSLPTASTSLVNTSFPELDAKHFMQVVRSEDRERHPYNEGFTDTGMNPNNTYQYQLKKPRWSSFPCVFDQSTEGISTIECFLKS